MRHAVLQQLASLQRAGVQQLPRVTIPVAAWPQNDPPPAASDAAPALAATPAPVAPPATPAPPAVSTSPPPPRPAPKPTAQPAAAPPARPIPAPTGISTPPAPVAARAAQSVDERRVALEVIQAEVKGCTRCSALVANRTQTVFGVGTLTPRLCFFGEAPGADEDRTGEPFVGRAGQLLDKIIDAMGLRREDVYILNVLKCRPPDNRPPQDDEIENCRGFYTRQLEVLRPEFICCLGASAAKTLLHSAFSIGKMRGRFYDAHGARAIVTYHPAYLLRNPAAKKDTWEDIQMLMREMGLPNRKADPS
ncbi:MAG: uracil-DNA glycosylase [Pirellulales bacterium]